MKTCKRNLKFDAGKFLERQILAGKKKKSEKIVFELKIGIFSFSKRWLDKITGAVFSAFPSSSVSNFYY